MSSKKDTDYKCTLSPDALETAKKELNEDPSTRLIEVKTLRDRLEKTPGLIPRTDTKFLLAFLRGRKFDQEKAYENVKNYYQARAADPELFEDMKPSRLKLVWEDKYIELLKDRDNDGAKIVLLRINRFNPSRYNIVDTSRILFLVCRQLLEDEDTQVYGVRVIVDMTDVEWTKAAHFTPAQAKRFFSVLQNVLPVRLKGMDFIREPTYFDIVFAICKQFMKDKVLNRTILHGEKYDRLHTLVKPEHLPVDLGGKVPEFSDKAWVKAFLTSDAYFEEDNKFGYVNLSLNSEQKTNKSEDAGLSGLGGTFKKLDI